MENKIDLACLEKETRATYDRLWNLWMEEAKEMSNWCQRAEQAEGTPRKEEYIRKMNECIRRHEEWNILMAGCMEFLKAIESVKRSEWKHK